jgi:hypothetical protein
MTDQQTTAPQGDAGDVAWHTARDIAHGYVECWANVGNNGEPSPHNANCEALTYQIAAALTQREQAARAAERERCAKVAEECVLGFHAEADELEAANRLVDTVSRQIAAAIRNPTGGVRA